MKIIRTAFAVLLVALAVVCAVVAVTVLSHLESGSGDSSHAEVIFAGSVWAIFAIGFLVSAGCMLRWR